MRSDLILRVEYNNQIYDLPVDNEVPLRIEMSTVESQELGNFFGIGSQTFNLPGLKETNRFFKHAYDVSVDSVPGMYNTIPCSVILNGETLLIGSLQLVQVITNEDGWVTYEVQVVDKVLQFEQALGSKLIKNADWSAYNHTFSSSSILDSWSDNLLSGSVYYPLVHYGYPNGEPGGYPQIALTLSGSNLGSFINNHFTPMQSQQFLPAVRLKDTLDVIFDQVGFTYTGSFTETADFQNLYILNKPQEGLGIVATGSAEPTFQASMQGQPAQRYVMQTSPSQWDRVSYQNEISDPTLSYTPICEDGPTYTDATGSKFTAPGTGEYTFKANVVAFNPLWASPSITGVCQITLMKGSLPCGAHGASGTVIATNSKTLSSLYGFNTFEVAITATDTITQGQDVWVWIEWYATAGTPSSPANDLQVGYFYNTFECTSGPISYEGATVDMSEQWQPDAKSLDVIKGLLQQFNLVMIPETGNKSVIRIEQFDDWIRQGEIKDWTYKYDTAKRISINHTIDELERELRLQNAEDNDRFSKITKESAPNYQYGTLRLLADNNISQGEKTIGDYFAPVILGGAVGYQASLDPTTQVDLATNFVYPHLYKLENNKLTSFAFKPRIGYKVTNNFPTNQYMYLGVYGASTLITGSYATIANVSDLPVVYGTSNDLHFNNTYSLFTGAALNLNSGVNNFTNYWKNYLDGLYWEGSKKVTLDLYFEPYEYKQIQLNDRILIKGQAYRINKISGFNVSHRDVVTVELIKLYPAYWQQSGVLPVPTVTPGTPTPTPTPGGPTPTPTPTATPTPAPSTPTPTPTATPTPTPGGVQGKLISTGTYQGSGYQYISWAVTYDFDGMDYPVTQVVGPGIYCDGGCTVSQFDSWTNLGSGTISIQRLSPSGNTQYDTYASVTFQYGSGTISGNYYTNISAGNSGTYTWNLTNITSDAWIDVFVGEG